MWTKKNLIIVLLTLATLFGCNENSVDPSVEPTNKILGKTELINFENRGSEQQILDGRKQILNQVAIFEDECNCPELTGVRTMKMNFTLNKDNCGSCYGTFTIEAKDAYWVGDWKGTISPASTTIRAKGQNLEDRDQYCEWKYFLPSSEEGEKGTYLAVINYDRY